MEWSSRLHPLHTSPNKSHNGNDRGDGRLSRADATALLAESFFVDTLQSPPESRPARPHFDSNARFERPRVAHNHPRQSLAVERSNVTIRSIRDPLLVLVVVGLIVVEGLVIPWIPVFLEMKDAEDACEIGDVGSRAGRHSSWYARAKTLHHLVGPLFLSEDRMHLLHLPPRYS